MTRRIRMAFLGLGLAWSLAAQESYKARLFPVPVDAQLVSTITGHGSASAILAGTKLTVNGTFEGMHSPAVAASLHQGKVTGIRGPAVHEISVSQATDGHISGSVELTRPEVDALRKGLLYILITSTVAPEGNLWGWLLK